MSATLLEAKAVISAEDRTGAVFANIQRKVDGLAKAANQIGRATAQVAAVSTKVAAAERAVASARAMGMREAALATGGYMGSRVMGYAGAAATIGAGMAAHKAAHAAAERAHERVRMEAAGMSAAEMREAEAKAAEIAAKTPSVSQSTVMHMLRNARTITGSFEEAAHIMEPLARLRVVAQGARPGQDVSEDFDKLVKGLEIKGVTQNPKQFHDYIEGIAKGLNTFGDTLKPYQYYEMFKYGRQATPMLSEKFILGTAPSLAQELGGSSYGKAVSAFNAALVNNVMKHSALKDFRSLGLIAENDLLYTKTGEAKGLKPGRHVKGWQVAQEDPNAWVRDYLLPALKNAGVTDKGEIMARAGALFQNQMASQLVGILLTQQTRIEKDLAMIERAPGLSAADKFQSQDPKIAWQGLKGAVEGAAGTIFAGTAEALAGPMNDLAHAIAGYTERLTKQQQETREHPGEPTGGQKRANGILDDIFGPRDHSPAAPPPDLGARAQQRIAGIVDKYAALAEAEKELAALDGPLSSPSRSTRRTAERSAESLRGRIAALRADIDDVEGVISADRARRMAQADLDRFNRNLPRGMGMRGSSEIAPIGPHSPLPTMTMLPPPGGGVTPMVIGAPQPPVRPADLSGLNGKITAQADVHASFDPATVNITVSPSSELISAVADMKQATLLARAAAAQSHSGQSMPQANPTRQ